MGAVVLVKSLPENEPRTYLILAVPARKDYGWQGGWTANTGVTSSRCPFKDTETFAVVGIGGRWDHLNVNFWGPGLRRRKCPTHLT